jgi:chaperone modulatory protein CbpM
MMDKTLAGTILDDAGELTLDELALICACESGWIIELVEEGILEPVGQRPQEWRFTAVCMSRVRTATRLHRDLEVNLAGVALAMELLDEISELKARLDILGGRQQT